MENGKNGGFKNSAFASPLSTAIIAALISVAVFSLPNVFKTGEDAAFILNAACRATVSVFFLIAAKLCGFKIFGKPKAGASEIFLLILGLLVCVNNFPIIGFICGNVSLVADAKIVRYVIYCALIGLSEEVVFRGFIQPLISVKFSGKPKEVFLTVLLSSAIFSLCHIFNVFSAGVGATALQLGYTFLTGGLFGAAFCFTGNIVFPTVLHLVFDVGGLIFYQPFGIAAGNMWDTVTIIITAVLGVAATAAYVFKLLNYQK